MKHKDFEKRLKKRWREKELKEKLFKQQVQAELERLKKLMKEKFK